MLLGALLLVSCSPDDGPNADLPNANAADWYHPRILPPLIAAAADAGIDLDRVVRETMAEADEHLPGEAPDVFVGGTEYVIPEIGVGGVTNPFDGKVTISLDPRTENLARTLTVWLPPVLAHELQHSSRVTDGPGIGRTLLDAFVAEGLADHFAHEVFPHSPQLPWDKALNERQEHRLWARAQPKLDRRDAGSLHSTWFFGTGAIPRWAGYTIGYDLVGSYLDERDIPPGVATRRKSTEILELSRFSP